MKLFLDNRLAGSAGAVELKGFLPIFESVLKPEALRHGHLDDDLPGEHERPSELGPAILPFVDGKPRGGNGSVIRCVNPATGEAFARAACADISEIHEAVESAVLASALWRGTPIKDRSECMLRLVDVIQDQAETLASLISMEQGKPFVEALNQEVLPALDHLSYYARNAADARAGELVQPRHPLYAHKRAHYLYDALGQVVIVTPHSMPFALPMVQAGAALAMGNAVLLKPSSLTPLTALRIGELCNDAGFPPGLVSVLPIAREDVIALTTHPKIDKVFFTGTIESGRQVMGTAGCIPRPVVLSLGGKHPTIIAGDADIERAARGVVWGALANCGQNCDSIERVYVEEPVASKLIDRVLKHVERIAVGDPGGSAVDIGPLVSDEQRSAVHRQVMEAVEGGGRLLCGGSIPDGPGYYYPPTVVLSPPEDCSLMREETLGPVIPIVVVESLERAVLLANDSRYALTASAWTGSSETAERLMSSLVAGTVTINDTLYAFDEPAAARAGYRMSGVGTMYGIPGLREMCRRRFVSHDHLPAEGPVFSFPYDDTAESTVRAVIRRLHARGRIGRLRGLFRLARIPRFRARVPKRFFWLSRGRRRR